VPAWCIEHYPAAVEAMVRDGHEVGFHGYIHEAPNALSREEEHYWMQRSIAVIEARPGQRPRGNRSPLYNFSIHTAELLAAEGFLYDSSLMGDDVPYLLSTPRGEVVELPVSWATDDWPPLIQSLRRDHQTAAGGTDPDRSVGPGQSDRRRLRPPLRPLHADDPGDVALRLPRDGQNRESHETGHALTIEHGG
jgi:peptidoglycan/xylan/chitin deacetylase (PgdA/CDA1 family)